MWLTRLFFIVLWGTITALLMKKPQVPQEFPVDSALLSFSPSKQTADTTAVILNWSRFPNVVRIVSLLCLPELENTLASIHIWNNSPNRILKEDFAECPPDRLQITNSPSNLYFQARFLACAEATTPFCFIQDDDYLVLPEIIQTLHSRFSNDSVSTIYLSPPHEVMSTILKRIHVKSKIHTSFAWLGYGAIMRRTQARDFLALMQYLNASEDEMKMADNYYALLANVYPEVWFDQGIELGGGQAFTQGAEGDERNNKHIAQAAKYLDEIINCTSTLCIRQLVPFTSLDDQMLSSVYRAPCVGSQCLLETNISLLPSTQIDVDSANQILEIEKINRNSFKSNDTKDFLLHPPSHAVDGNPQTGFCIPKGVRKGDTIEIDLLGAVAKSGQAEVVFLVDRDVRSILIAAATLQFRGNDEWFESSISFTCVSKEDDLHECSASTPLTRFSAFRIFFQRAVERRGCLQEIWMRER
ncbi:uncharacterized protein C8R40DRAFT_1076224 [Lentinula edodes]|uniref:uncharacterized protein n=1 Tax=Lentinula edodes TaxID=5353 RepID=UPI001E8D06C1|nr:uncharacterized protein C8R40DRAFT_1076224 [Lentinula edodes]KAH7881028.1 hypothetical protein C8R40DRAFT_1076224 [Lentinula edodes]